MPTEGVSAARQEEVSYMMGRDLWSPVSAQECWEKTGKAPVSVRWVDTNKGTEEELDIRSKLMAQALQRGGQRQR